jgi:C-terminal processing protease CtpA/Prc
MRVRQLLGMVIVAVVALGVSGLALAGGHDCKMKPEECADMMKKDMSTRGWLGIQKEMSEDGKMTVTKIYPGSPAEKAGFQVGDKIVSINGVECGEKNEEKIRGLMKDAKIGDKLSYVVARGSENVTLEATLVKISDEALTDRVNQHVKEDHKTVKN